MSVRYKKKHIRRSHADEFNEWVTVAEDGLSVTVAKPDWPSARTFDFRFLIPFVRTSLAQAITSAFGPFAARFARPTAVTRYLEFRQLWLAISPDVLRPHGVAGFRAGALANAWKEAARAYAAAEYGRVEALTTAKISMQSLWTVLDELASCGLLPDVPAIQPPKNIHLRKVPKPGLVELTARGRLPSDESKSELIRHFRSIGVPVEDPEAEAYIDMLASVLTSEERKDPKKTTQAYISKSKAFVSAVIEGAESEFLRWAEHYSRGQQLLLASNPEVLKAFDAQALTGRAFRRFFPIHDTETSAANFLLLVRERFKGRVPSTASLPAHFCKPSRAQNLYRELGGVHHLDAMLTLHRNAVASASILYIADAGANVSTAISLESAFERPTSEPGIVELYAVKARANYAPIYDALPVNEPGRRISTVKALRFVLEATGNLRREFPSLGESLFVYRFFVESSVANGQFLSLRAEASETPSSRHQRHRRDVCAAIRS